MSSDRRPRITVISALTARTQFGQIMRRAREKDERFMVDRRGEPQVIIMSLRDYIDTIAPAPEWLKAIRAEAKRETLPSPVPMRSNGARRSRDSLTAAAKRLATWSRNARLRRRGGCGSFSSSR